LADEKRGCWRKPTEKERVSMMTDGIPAPGPSIFTKTTLLMKTDRTVGNLEI
jgi:hypothetical protein